MTTEERIAELEEKKSEYILNETSNEIGQKSVSWGELADLQAIAEKAWDETDEGKELKALLISKPVELIASGYEWECPVCETFNKQSGVTEKVTCSDCHNTFTVSDYNHAFGE